MIKVGDKYAIGSNSLSVVVYERHISKNGKESWKESAYFATPANALKYLVDQHVRDTGLKDLKTVCQEIDRVYDLIKIATSATGSVVAHVESIKARK